MSKNIEHNKIKSNIRLTNQKLKRNCQKEPVVKLKKQFESCQQSPKRRKQKNKEYATMVRWKSNGKDKENVEIKLVKKSEIGRSLSSKKAQRKYNSSVHEVVGNTKLFREHEEKLSYMDAKD